jgi:hypothetical protein
VGLRRDLMGEERSSFPNRDAAERELGLALGEQGYLVRGAKNKNQWHTLRSK